MYRSWSWIGVRRTVGHALLTGVILSLPFGFVLLVVFREWRRYEIWSSVRPMRVELRKEYGTSAGRRTAWRRVVTSAPGQALLLQLVVLPLWLLVLWYGITGLPPEVLLAPEVAP